MVSDVAATAEGVMERINELPIEELMQGAVDLMASIEALATDGDLRAAPQELRTILSDVSSVIAADGIQSAPDSLRNSLDGIQQVVAEIATIVGAATEADFDAPPPATPSNGNSPMPGSGSRSSITTTLRMVSKSPSTCCPVPCAFAELRT